MKKLLLLLVLIFGALNMDAQTIKRDLQRDDYRIIQTSYENFAYTKGVFKGKFPISLECLCSENDTIYHLIPQITLMEKNTISENAKMILKLKDGAVITAISKDGVGIADYKFQVYGTTTVYYLFPVYTIDEDDLKLLVNNECTKIRLECNWDKGYFDLGLDNNTIKKFNLTETVSKLYNLIQEQLKVNNDIYKDF